MTNRADITEQWGTNLRKERMTNTGDNPNAKITLRHEERTAMFQGRYPTLVRDKKPRYGKGSIYVLKWSRPFTARDPETGKARTSEPEMLYWIRVTDVKQSGEKWLVNYEIFDRRDAPRFMRRVPPVRSVEEQDAVSSEKAREESSYQSTTLGAVEGRETVDDRELDRYAAENRAVDKLASEWRDQEKAKKRRKVVDLERDLANALREAAAKGIDTSSVRFITERQIARLRKRIDRAAAA